MKKYYLSKLSPEEYAQILKRPSINISGAIESVKPILEDVKLTGLPAVIKYAKKFDDFEGEILVSQEEIKNAEKDVDPKVKAALKRVYKNIEKYHLPQKPVSYRVETEEGVECYREFRAIENVGLYIPGGTAPLPSTVLMLGIPAKIAGCKRIVATSPSSNKKINPEILYSANLCGITEFYKIGGAQAIALLAYGDTSIKKTDKIFGPGNQYVTAAKMLASIDPEGCAIDMPAGPSEVLVLADKYANLEFIVADLLSQAEHGTDSQSILVTENDKFAVMIDEEIERQLKVLKRKTIIRKSLRNTYVLIVDDIAEAIKFSNDYAPEHLILNIKNAPDYISKIENAGSVFLGAYSPESAGDYASGTNHSLPTYGYAKSNGGVSVESFMKSISFQQLSSKGLHSLAETVIELAEAESLDAHANAVKVRQK